MSDELTNPDLKLILRNTGHASRDALAALEATDRLATSIGARFDAIDGRLSAMESRMVGVERQVTGTETGMDAIARSNHRMEQMLADIVARFPTS